MKKRVTWTKEEWSDWRWHQKYRIRNLEQLEEWIDVTPDEREAFRLTDPVFHMGITPYYASLMDPEDPNCPIRLQAVPKMGETKISNFELEDPLGEESNMVVPGLTHRYPDRVLFYTNHNCAMYCRFCTRKRKVADPKSMTSKREYREIFDYLAAHPEVNDVLISGGDPLSLADKRLATIFEELSAIPSIKYCRLGSRNLVTLPQRCNDEFTAMLKHYQSRHLSIFFNTHYNCVEEITDEAWDACDRVAQSGTPMNNQMVLMKGINDSVEKVSALNRSLLQMRVRPYYMFQCDLAEGTSHFRTSIATGLEIVKGLRGHMSGMASPHYVVDAPGGGGKIPLSPNYVIGMEEGSLVFRNFLGDVYRYPESELELETITPECLHKRLKAIESGAA
jgi:lysine 2,3-aminomutase